MTTKISWSNPADIQRALKHLRLTAEILRSQDTQKASENPKLFIRKPGYTVVAYEKLDSFSGPKSDGVITKNHYNSGSIGYIGTAEWRSASNNLKTADGFYLSIEDAKEAMSILDTLDSPQYPQPSHDGKIDYNKIIKAIDDGTLANKAKQSHAWNSKLGRFLALTS